jgi:hypothetical protein
MKVREGGRAIGGMSAIVQKMTAPIDDHISVPVERIDEIVSDRYIGIVHLDVEGYEEPALEGAMQTISRCRPIIILETVPAEWCRARLAPLGYKNRGTMHENTVFSVTVPDNWEGRSAWER